MKRRNFIGSTLIGSAGISLGASNLPFPSSVLGANDKIVLGLIGSGSRGLSTIVSTCQINANVVIKTVCDVNDLKAAKAISTIEKVLGYKPLRSKNMKEVFNDKEVDAVWISTPEHWHSLATVWACQAGKDVYVEKPITLNVNESEELVNLAREKNKILMEKTSSKKLYIDGLNVAKYFF